MLHSQTTCYEITCFVDALPSPSLFKPIHCTMKFVCLLKTQTRTRHTYLYTFFSKQQFFLFQTPKSFHLMVCVRVQHRRSEWMLSPLLTNVLNYMKILCSKQRHRAIGEREGKYHLKSGMKPFRPLFEYVPITKWKSFKSNRNSVYFGEEKWDALFTKKIRWMR